MQIKMLKVSASPALCADVGEIVTVDEGLGKALIKVGAAKMSTPVGREDASFDPVEMESAELERSRKQAEEEVARKSPAAIVAALNLLDQGDDDHWTAAGKPAMDRLKDITGHAGLTRSDVDDAAPDFKRNEVVLAEAVSTEVPPAAEPKPSSAAAQSTARSSAP